MFAVAAEEFGIVLCLALVALFAFVVIRALQHAFRDEDPFTRFAVAGLAILFGTQSAINMAVNLHLIPAKGMTLPFISYGGSSMISLAYGMGMLLALTRERPRAAMIQPMRAPAARVADGLMRERPLVLLAAGGTGGHLFPAEALAEALQQARHRRSISRPTNARRAMGMIFRRAQTHVIPSATIRGRDPVSLAKTAGVLGIGAMKALRLMRRIRPVAVVGFGGYPTLPPVLAATLRRIPTVIHDANAVMGRANRMLAPRVTAIATSFPGMALDAPLAAKATFTGNPVRPMVIAAAAQPYAAPVPRRSAQSSRHRRQPGRARDGRHRAGSDRAPRARPARAARPSCSRRGERTRRGCARPMRGSA